MSRPDDVSLSSSRNSLPHFGHSILDVFSAALSRSLSLKNEGHFISYSIQSECAGLPSPGTTKPGDINAGNMIAASGQLRPSPNTTAFHHIDRFVKMVACLVNTVHSENLRNSWMRTGDRWLQVGRGRPSCAAKKLADVEVTHCQLQAGSST